MNEPGSLLSLKGIQFWRGGGAEQRMILRDISWQVQPSEIAAILGANGSGKSTLLRIISGYLWPQRGTIELLGNRFGEVALAPLRARIGIVEATTVYPFDEGITAHEVVVTGYFSSLTLGYVRPTREQMQHGAQLLEQVGLTGHRDQLYFTLSTGERLRCLLARALVRRPELLLLDEPTAGLDLPAREAVLATLARLHRESGKVGTAPAMVTITHHLEELLPNTSNLLLLSRTGEAIAQGRPEGVLTDAHLSAAYGVPIRVTRQHQRYHAHVDPQAWEELI